MTDDKTRKAKARALAAETGINYTTALRQLDGEQRPVGLKELCAAVTTIMRVWSPKTFAPAVPSPALDDEWEQQQEEQGCTGEDWCGCESCAASSFQVKRWCSKKGCQEPTRYKVIHWYPTQVGNDGGHTASHGDGWRTACSREHVQPVISEWGLPHVIDWEDGTTSQRFWEVQAWRYQMHTGEMPDQVQLLLRDLDMAGYCVKAAANADDPRRTEPPNRYDRDAWQGAQEWLAWALRDLLLHTLPPLAAEKTMRLLGAQALERDESSFDYERARLATRARGQGNTWEQIAESMAFPNAGACFAWLCDGFKEMNWTCTFCQGQIWDKGPGTASGGEHRAGCTHPEATIAV